MIDLAQNRKLVICPGTRRFGVTVLPIPQAAWLECLDAMTSIAGHVEADIPFLDLLEKFVIAADGYPDALPGQGVLSRVPWTHRVAYANELISMNECRVEAVNRRSDERSIRVRGLWSMGRSGGMTLHKDLVHVFKIPSISQILNFRRAFPPPQMVKMGRRERGAGITRTNPLAGRMCSALYDEFVIRVEGYALNGVPLGDDRSAIVSWMDTYHKVVAAGLLIVG